MIGPFTDYVRACYVIEDWEGISSLVGWNVYIDVMRFKLIPDGVCARATQKHKALGRFISFVSRHPDSVSYLCSPKVGNVLKPGCDRRSIVQLTHVQGHYVFGLSNWVHEAGHIRRLGARDIAVNSKNDRRISGVVVAFMVNNRCSMVDDTVGDAWE